VLDRATSWLGEGSTPGIENSETNFRQVSFPSFTRMSSEWLLVACHCRAAMSSLTDARPGINPKHHVPAHAAAKISISIEAINACRHHARRRGRRHHARRRRGRRASHRAAAPAVAATPRIAAPIPAWSIPGVSIPAVVAAALEKLNLFQRKSRARRRAYDGIRHGSSLRAPAYLAAASRECDSSRNARQSTHLLLLERLRF